MSESFESVRWNAYVHRLKLGLCSHPKEFDGMDSEPMFIPREKSPLPEAEREEGEVGSHQPRCITQGREPNVLPTELSRPPTFHCPVGLE